MAKVKNLYTVEYKDIEQYVVASDMNEAIVLWKRNMETDDDPDNIVYIDNNVVYVDEVIV